MTATATAAVAEIASILVTTTTATTPVRKSFIKTAIPAGAVLVQQTLSIIHPFHFVHRKQLNINNILMIFIIIIANIINISTSQSPTSNIISTSSSTTTASIEQFVIPPSIQQHQQINYRPEQYQPQYQPQHHQQQQPPQESNNIFRQINSFIQARQRNASEIAGNIFFKYYNA